MSATEPNTYLDRRAQNLAALHEYALQLVEAGFDVWLSDFGGGYLTYEKDGLRGSFQDEAFGEYQHLMALPPSREFGSDMYIQDPLPPWTVEAAEQCASPSNYNKDVGRQPNIGTRAVSAFYLRHYGTKVEPATTKEGH